jgi:hypothetical protein
MLDKKNIILNIATNKNKIRESYFINNFIEIWNEIENYYLGLNLIIDITFKDKIWLWVNNELDLPKCFCGNYTKIYPNWIDGYRRNCSVKCSSKDPIRIENAKKSTIEKWGNENYFKSEYYLDKSKQDNIKRWGVDHYSKTDEFKNKIKETSLNKWGVDHYSKTDEFKNKIKETNFSNWGVSNPFQSEIIKNKIKETLLFKWGVDNYTKTDEYKLKVLKTNNDKYNSDFYMGTEDFKTKSKKTILEKWGVDHYSKTDEFKTQTKETSLSKWGVEYPNQSNEIKNKKKKTNIEKFGSNSHTTNEEHRVKNYKISQNKWYLNYISDNLNLFKCDMGGEHNFEILSTTYYSRSISNIPLCTICNPISKTSSFKEKDIYDFIKSIYSGKIIQSYRDGLEIDIYLPELHLGFEFNGLYWHSDGQKDKNYHLDKTNYFKERGVRIIHIWEDDWRDKEEILKSQILYLLNNIKNKIWARKCEVKEVHLNDCREFLNKNHIQGYVNSKVKIGLYYSNELVGIMAFDQYEGRKKMKDGGWNLNRFCNKLETNVIGGASKLLNYFIKNYSPTRIISYADRDWSEGNLYYKLGFNLLSVSKPDYKYISNKKRLHKSNFKKSILKSELSEYKTMLNSGYSRIWDCGKLKFEINIVN